MLTSLFGNSKPINFIVVAIYITVFYFLTGFQDMEGSGYLYVLQELGILLVLLFSMILLNFIAKRNELTGRNSYKIILFAAFSFMILGLSHNSNIILSNLFVLLALRRIISLRSQRSTAKKIFDSTLWICIASLFYFWAILFLSLVFFGVLVFVRQNYKNWLIPLVSTLTVFVLVNCVNLLISNEFFLLSQWFEESNYDFSSYQDPRILIPVAFLIALTLWCTFFYFGAVERTSANLKASLILIFLALVIGYLIAFFAPTKNSSEFAFLLAPLAIVVTNYLQIARDKWFREILLLIIILLPAVLLIFF